MVEKFCRQDEINLKHGQKIKIVSNSKKFTDIEHIVIKFDDLHKMLSPGDKIIINDNKASLTVEKIVECENVKSRQRIYSETRITNENEEKFVSNNKSKNIRSLTKTALSNNSKNSQNSGSIPNEINENIIKKINEKDDERQLFHHIPRVRTNLEPDIKFIFDKIDNYDNQRNQEFDDLKKIEFEQDLLFEMDKEELENLEKDKIDNFIQNVAIFSEHKYTDRIFNEEIEFILEKSKDMSSFKSSDSNCMSCPNNNIKLNEFPKIREQINSVLRFSQYRVKKPQIIKKYEIICIVDYDCRITNNSFLYIPGNLRNNIDLNYKKFDIELLSPREVAQIEILDKLVI